MQNLGYLAAQLHGVISKKHFFSMREFKGVPIHVNLGTMADMGKVPTEKTFTTLRLGERHKVSWRRVWCLRGNCMKRAKKWPKSANSTPF